MAFSAGRALRFLAAIAILAACEEETAPPETVIRAVKTIVLKTRAGEQTRMIAGITEASTVTDLAFETGGRVVDIQVDIGDSLSKGDVVARLDDEPYKLDQDV